MKPEVVRVVIDGQNGCDVRGLLHGDAQSGLFRVSFRYDGDSVDVELIPEGVHYSRRGSQFVDVVYAEGKRTVCRIGTGPLAGEFEVITKSVAITAAEGRTDVEVRYRPVEPGNGENIVKLSICRGDQR